VSVRLTELTTPALVIDPGALDHNLMTMAAERPGAGCRPHVKAHKITALARRQAAVGHRGFTCATIAECAGMVAAGLGSDLLLANEVVDATRVGALVAAGARVTVAVDSDATLAAAVHGGVREVVIDVNVGLPRCGCEPADAGRLAETARGRGLEVRGVMGYEGHVVGLPSRERRATDTETAMAALLVAHGAVGGELISGGGTGTYDLNRWVTEVQAGSYVLMDSAYGQLGLPFRQALFIVATVISVNRAGGYAVADCGLKALGMDHGNPTIAGATVRFCSDEHVTFSAPALPAVGDRVWVVPAHIDPTMAYHARVSVLNPALDAVDEQWEIDLRGW